MNGTEAKALVLKTIRQAIVHADGEPELAQYETILARVKKLKFPKGKVRLLGSSQKVDKGEKKGYLTAVLYLAPWKRVVPYGGQNLCIAASPGCRAWCLGHCAGNMRFSTVQNAQLWKAVLLTWCPETFYRILADEIQAHVDLAKAKGMIPCVRLNGTSDLAWFRIWRLFPNVQFYEYTKRRELTLLWDSFPNVHWTYSRTENDDLPAIRAMLNQGVNVAVVFAPKAKPATGSRWAHSFPVVDGDETDLRFLDPKGVVVALKAKGKANRDKTGFVVRKGI